MARVQIQIKDKKSLPKHVPVLDATINILPSGSSNVVANGSSSDFGNFVAVLPGGFYDIVIQKGGLSVLRTGVAVKDEKPITFSGAQNQNLVNQPNLRWNANAHRYGNNYMTSGINSNQIEQTIIIAI